MKQLTRNEIVELRARAIYSVMPDKELKLLPNTAGGYNKVLMPIPYDELDDNNQWDKERKESLKNMAVATIDADEKAGVLMLVDDEPRKGDSVFTNISSYYGKISMVDNIAVRIKNNTISPLTDFYKVDVKIIQRNNTPVYQCKKKVKND